MHRFLPSRIALVLVCPLLVVACSRDSEPALEADVPAATESPRAASPAGTQDPYAALMEDSAEFLTDVNGVLATIESPAAAEDARDPLAALVDRMGELQQRRDALGDPPEDRTGSPDAAASYIQMMNGWQAFLEQEERLSANAALGEPVAPYLDRLSEFFEEPAAP